MTERCVQCGQPISQKRTGRRRRFCGEACRRLAEFAIRRLTRQIDGIACAVSAIRIDGATSSRTLLFPSVEAALAAYEAEQTRLEARLRELLAGDAK